MTKSFFYLLFILAISNTSVFAQDGLDDIKQKLKLQTNPTARMHVMLEIANKYQDHNSDSALKWYNKIIPFDAFNQESFDLWIEHADDAQKYYVTVSLARSGLLLFQKQNLHQGKINLEAAFGMAMSANNVDLALYCSDNLGVFLAQSGQLEEASVFFERSYEIYIEQNDMKGILFCLGNLGALNANMGNLYKAASYYERLLTVQQESITPLETLEDLMNIAALYTGLEEFERALPFWERSLSVAKNLNNSKNQQVIFSQLGAITYKLNLFDKSLSAYQSLLEISTSNLPDKRIELQALNNLAMVYNNLGKYDQSIAHWERALELSKELGYGQVLLDALLNLSNLYYQLETLEKASSYYENYLRFAKQIADVGTMVNSYINIAEIQEQLGNFKKAREYFNNALDLYREQNNADGMASINVLIGKSFLAEKHYSSALDFFKANIELPESISAKNLALTFQGQADVYRQQMLYPLSLENYQKALDLWLDLNNNNQASVCLNAMGFILEVTGNLPKAVSHYETALRISQDMGNNEAIAAVLNNLGVVYRKLGDLLKARESYQRALDIYIQINNEDGAAYCYNNLGIVFELSGSYKMANEFYEKSLAIKQTSQDQKGLATSFMNMGNVYKFLRNYEKAEEYYIKALGISNDIFDEQGKAFALGGIASLKLEIYDYNTAIDFANQSLDIASKIDMKNTMKEAYRQLAWAYNATLIPDWAEESYFKVIEMNYDEINRNFSILSESEKELFFKTVTDDFDRFHSFALNRMVTNPTITKDVYNNLLRNKGLLLKSSTAMRNAILNSENKALIHSFEQWIQIRQEIVRLYTLPAEQRESDPEELEKQANNLERLLVRSSSEFSDFDQSLRVDYSDVRSGLMQNEAAIEFTHFSHGRDSVLYCALIVTNNFEYPVLVPLFNEDELKELLGQFGGNNLTYINGIYGLNNDTTTTLYNLIWRPIENHLKGIEKVFISPSGLLHKVSFAGISKDQNRYLMDDYTLQMVSTTANVISNKGFEVNSETSISLFGGIKYSTHPNARETWAYLQGTLDEASIIKGILKGNLGSVNFLVDTLASEEQFKRLAPQSQIIHVATHGFFYPDPTEFRQFIEESTEIGDVKFRGGSPSFGMDNFIRNQNPLMRSGLVFSGVNDFWSGARAVQSDDGVLTALEVINIDLRNNQLVVMSACETGLGDIAGSEGVYGLQRAFKMAGTNFLIMSLWQVPDKETAEFMQNFYQLLLRCNLQEAFTKTQQIMREKYDPFFWAAFVLLE